MTDKDALSAVGASSFADVTGLSTLGTLWTYVTGEYQQRHSIALRAAEKAAHCSREELADRIKASPRSVDRLIRLLYAAGLNGHDQVLRMMGHVLVRGLVAEETGNVEAESEDSRILDTLTDLQPRHVLMLSYIEMHPLADNVALGAALKPEDPFTDQTGSELLARGFVENPHGRHGGDSGEDRFYQVSRLGELILRLAEEVSIEDWTADKPGNGFGS